MADLVEKVFLFTHPSYGVGNKEIAKDKAEQAMMEQIRGIVDHIKDDPNTHVIISWCGGGPDPTELREIMSQIPKERFHELKRNAFLGDSPEMQAELSKLNYAEKLTVETYGRVVEACVSQNMEHLVKFVDDRARTRNGSRVEIDKIRLVGGKSATNSPEFIHGAFEGRLPGKHAGKFEISTPLKYRPKMRG